MGQYWKLVNLTKKEFVDPFGLGFGVKLWEILANHPSAATAMVVLCAAMPERRGGGDLDLDENMHGPERRDHSGPGPMPDSYPQVARRTIGRWAGDRVVLIGDYAEDGDLPKRFRAGSIYGRCVERSGEEKVMRAAREAAEQVGEVKSPLGKYLDITEDVRVVIGHELHEHGHYEESSSGFWRWEKKK